MAGSSGLLIWKCKLKRDINYDEKNSHKDDTKQDERVDAEELYEIVGLDN